MLVAFRGEVGDDGKALAGLLSEVIGSIQTVKGCCTIRRASGVAVQVSPGDPICQGDVIETAADGRIGICFLDGTVFDLFPGTRLALHEFVCDANGTSHSLLVGVTGGTFAFMAGRLAETSRLTVDTPFGSIRGRAHSGGFGMLWLTALTLSMLGEIRAADPDIAILDDDRITYKDLDFGVLELTTKEPIPKYIRVEDPEKTIVLHQQERGSSVSVNQVTNSAARMEELQAAQRDVFANLIGGTGSGTPPSVNSSPVQRINYTPADLPTLQNSEPPPLFTTAVLEITVPLLPGPPTLSVPTGPIEIDTVVFDAFTARSGTFAASSIRSDVTLTFGVSGGTAGSTVLGGTTYDLSKTGTYGTFYVNSTTGAYTFVPDSGAINALKAPTTESFIITVSDGSLSVNQTFALTFNGTNDAAIISGTPTGSVIEAGGVANAATGTPTATGTLTDIDVDDPPNTFTAVSLPGGYGTFTMTAAGVWTYTLDNANSAVQALNVGGTLTDTFTVTTIDGTAKVVTININGSNDVAIISGTTTGSVTEIRGVVNATPGTETATGTLTDTDLDNPPNTFTAVSLPGGYGTFTMTAAGVWTYTLDDTNSAVQALNVGDTRTDTFTVSSVDGTPQVVTITIHGPLIGATGTAPSLTLSESHLTTTSGNFSTAFTSVQGVDGATISYALSIAGGNGTASGLIDSRTGQADVLVLNGNTIEGHVGSTGGALAFTIQLDPTTGVVTFTEYRAVTQPFGSNPDGGEGVSLTAGIVNLTATITETDGDFQTASIDLGKQLTIQDDGPTIDPSGVTPSVLVTDDTDTPNDIAGPVSFAGLFTPDFGADGFKDADDNDVEDLNAIKYALGVSAPGGVDSGLVDTLSGDAIYLFLEGTQVVGRVGLDGGGADAAGAVAFTISVDLNSGDVTLEQDRAVVHDDPTDPVETGASAAALAAANLVTLTATITDGDLDTDIATVDIGGAFAFEDDGPTIDPSGVTPSVLVTDDTDTPNDIAGPVSFAGLFTPDFGADGFKDADDNDVEDLDAIKYALGVSAPGGVDSGLVDTLSGDAIYLFLEGTQVVGRVGLDGGGADAAGAVAFTISVDLNSGDVTLEQDRAVVHDDPTDPVETGASAAALAAANLVTLTATITDGDLDTDIATVDIGGAFAFEDDGPTIDPSGVTPSVLVTDDTDTPNDIAGPVSFAGLFTPDFGADGFKDADDNDVEDLDAIKYALGVSAPGGVDSGLVDTLSGDAIYLFLEGTQVVGRVGLDGGGADAAGAVAFTISVDLNSGDVTLEQDRAVVHDDPTDPVETGASAAALAAANLVTLTATITDGDLDTDIATVDIGGAFAFEDDGPTIDPSGVTPSVLVTDDTDTPNDIAGPVSFAGLFTPDFGADGFKDADDNDVEDLDAIKYALGVSAPGGVDSGLVDTLSGDAIYLFLEGTQVVGRVGLDGGGADAAGAVAFTISVDLSSGDVTLEQDRAVVHDDPTDPVETGASAAALAAANLVTLTATITDGDLDTDIATVDIGGAFAFEDDGPTIDPSGVTPSVLVTDDTDTPNDIAGPVSFAGLFTPDFGADGFKDADDNDVEDLDAIKYALGVSAPGGVDSGLVDTLSGDAIYLFLEGTQVVGRVGLDGGGADAAGAVAFTISVDLNSGDVTLEQDRAVVHDDPTDPVETGASAAALAAANLVTLTATITDGDLDTDIATVDIGGAFAFEDDGPTIDPSGVTPSVLVTDDTDTPNDIAGPVSFAGLFTPDFGADGFKDADDNDVEDLDAIKYALGVSAPGGVDSGLVDTLSGDAIYLFLEGTQVVGRVGLDGGGADAAGAVAFTISVDLNSGDVTLEQDRAVVHDDPTDPVETGASAAALAAANLVTLTATITDGDLDTDIATVDIGGAFAFEDDGPTIGGFGEISILAQNNRVVTAMYNVSFGADGDGAMRVAIHDGAVNGYNLTTTDLGGGITSVHVTGNGDDYTFYYTTHAVSGGVELDAFFTNTSGTLSDAFFTLLIDPDGNYTFDIKSVGLLQQRTVSGSDFGASSSGQSSLTSPDGHLIITGDFNGAPADVKASSNGIAVGDTGLQMDQHETLLLKFTQEQTDVSFILTQWQGNGTADVVFQVHDGATDIHDFNINIPKPSGDARIVVEKTSNLALVNTYTFDSATSTYTLYVGSEFDQIGVSYDHAVTGNTTFTINNITYDERTIPSTDLLFDVTAVDGDGDSSRASLQVHLLGGTSAASSLALSSTPSADALVGDSGNATLTDPFMATTISGSPQAVTTTNAAAIISSSTTGFVLEAGGASPGTPTATGTLTATDVDNPFNTFTPVSSPTPSASGYGSFTMTAAGMWIYMLDNANSAVENLNNGDTLTDSFTVTTVDGTPQVVSITIHGATDADINDFDALATRATVTTEPPFVYGTTGDDSIAGGGNDGQTAYGGAGGDTINGTGQDDTIYAGSGNDTVKGNGGNDTIFGGSGIDTINGNNDDDTIVGGFGADNLTGSNGDDRFVYLSVADSNAARFDTITDFSSGSDRIDLTALGAFAFLALTSASTSVPPHTIAWIYDSATNQTIVYVNPTDQTLSIGSSALLEIHLQGVVAVASTDFVFAAEAASASAAGEPINLELAATAETDGAVFAMASADGIVDDADAKVQTSDVGFSLDADRDRPDSGHARIVSFGEDRTQPTEVNENNTVVTAENGQSVVPHHLHFAEPTEFRFAFDPAPALDNTSAMTAHDAMMHPGGAIHHASITAPDAPGNIAELQPDVNGQGSEGGSGNAPSHSHGNNGSQVNSAVPPNEDNLGLPEVSVNHGQAVASLAANSGEPPAHGNNNHSIPGDAGEHGSNPSHGAPSNAHGMSGGGGNAPSHSHGNNGSQTNPTIALNDDNLGAPEVSGNHGQAVASLVANSGEPPAHANNNHSIPGDAGEHGSNPSHGAPSNAHGMSGGGGNAPSHSHGNNGAQVNSAVTPNDDNLGLPEVSGNHGQAVASLVANSGEPPAHGNNNHSIPGDASEHGTDPSHGAPPSNAHGMSEAAGTPGPGDSFQFSHAMAGSESNSGNAPSHSHGNNGSQTNSTVTFNEDNLGVPEVSGTHGQAVASLDANSGEPPANGNNHSIPGDEYGAAQSHGAPSSNPHGLANSAAAGTPGLGDSFHFNLDIAGSEGSGIVELASLDPAPASTGRHANAAGNGQAGESQIIELSLPGNSADHFQGHPGNTHAQHDLMV